MPSKNIVSSHNIDCNEVMTAMPESIKRRLSILLQMQIHEQLFTAGNISKNLYMSVKQDLEKELENE